MVTPKRRPRSLSKRQPPPQARRSKVGRGATRTSIYFNRATTERLRRWEKKYGALPAQVVRLLVERHGDDLERDLAAGAVEIRAPRGQSRRPLARKD